MGSSITEFSIFLPVRNGGSYLPLCVESILAQNYRNFELIILENESTDGTAEWLQTLERKDPRVRVVPSESSLSIEENWKRILGFPKKRFMTIVGHDDLLEPVFLNEINTLIQSEPDENLYSTHFKLIDCEGKQIRYCKPIPKIETGAEFLAARLAEIRDSFGTGYVMRSDAYDKFGGIQPFSNLLYADDALWLGLMENSLKVTSPNVCFSYRLHSGSVSGKADTAALINALKQYLSLLSKMASENKELEKVYQLYVPQYVDRICKDIYFHYYRLKLTTWRHGAVKFKLSELDHLLIIYAPEKRLDKSLKNFIGQVCRKLIA